MCLGHSSLGECRQEAGSDAYRGIGVYPSPGGRGTQGEGVTYKEIKAFNAGGRQSSPRLRPGKQVAHPGGPQRAAEFTGIIPNFKKMINHYLFNKTLCHHVLPFVL